MSSSEMYQQLDADRLRVMDIGIMCGIPAALNAAIKLGVPEILSNHTSPLSASQIVSQVPACKSSPDPLLSSANLDRILRVLAGNGVLQASVENGVRKYGLTSLSRRYLVKNNSGVSLSSWVAMHQEEVILKTWQYLYESVSVGADTFTAAHGKRLFDWGKENPEYSHKCNSAMSDTSTVYVNAIAEKYRGFQGSKTIVDVGGGNGTSLSIILLHNTEIQGINFDLPHVVAKASPFPGVEHVGGNMFERVPKGDIVFMKWILHDWNDEECVTLLKKCFESLPSDGKVVAMDTILPSETTNLDLGSRFALSMDLLMLAYTGGKERTLQEFDAIAKAAGFLHINVALTIDQFSVVELHKQPPM